MKALVLEDIGTIAYKDIDKPEPKEGEVLLEVKSCGICGSDIPRAYKEGAHNMPLVIGHEFAGRVESVGQNVDSSLIGKRVGVFPLIPCKKCSQCQKHRYEMCKHYDYLGSRSNGGFAEYVSVPQWNLIELPENVSYEEAAMLEPMAVAAHAMRRVDINPEDTILVCGVGTIGTLLTMLLIERGYKNIYVTLNKDFQKDTVLSLGIQEENICDVRQRNIVDFVNDKTDSEGVNVYFECVGSNDTVSEALKVIAPAGKICYIGNPHSDMIFDKDIYWQILRKQVTITGTWNSSFDGQDEDDWHYVLKRLEAKSIEPGKLITHRYKLEDITEGMEIMRDKSQDYIKIMTVM